MNYITSTIITNDTDYANIKNNIIYKCKNVPLVITNITQKEAYEINRTRYLSNVLKPCNYRFSVIDDIELLPPEQQFQLFGEGKNIHPTIHNLLKYNYVIDFIKDNYNVIPTGKDNTIVILDTGINTDHEAFQPGYKYKLTEEIEVAIQPEQITARTLLNDNEGVEDIMPSGGHGTPVTYIALSFAPESRIISYRVTKRINNNIMAEDIDIVRALDSAVTDINEDKDKSNVGVINISLGGPDTQADIIKDFIQLSVQQYPWIVYSVAAGNSGPAPRTIETPASSPSAVAIGSCNTEFIVSEFSSRGPNKQNYIKPEFVLPGESLIAASADDNDSYKAKTGTSFSTPIFSGGISLAISSFIEAVPPIKQYMQEIKEARLNITQILNNIGPKMTIKPVIAGANLYGKDNNYGYGIIMGDLTARQLGLAIRQISEPTIPFMNMLFSTALFTTLIPVIKNIQTNTNNNK